MRHPFGDLVDFLRGERVYAEGAEELIFIGSKRLIIDAIGYVPFGRERSCSAIACSASDALYGCESLQREPLSVLSEVCLCFKVADEQELDSMRCSVP
jgi:phage terminase large subunit-like protein